MSTVQYLSAEGLKKLQNELHELKTVRRAELTERIEAAKALGDLAENAEYHEAMDALQMVEARIYEVSEALKNYQLIEDTGGKQDVVRIGSTVQVKVNGKERTFTIVGSNEADPLVGKISNESPIGSALLGKQAGEQTEVRSPAGLVIYQVVAIQ
ncbi:MAG: transcription elongation factor GreA [Patescibacteria group bacterium]